MSLGSAMSFLKLLLINNFFF